MWIVTIKTAKKFAEWIDRRGFYSPKDGIWILQGIKVVIPYSTFTTTDELWKEFKSKGKYKAVTTEIK